MIPNFLSWFLAKSLPRPRPWRRQASPIASALHAVLSASLCVLGIQSGSPQLVMLGSCLALFFLSLAWRTRMQCLSFTPKGLLARHGKIRQERLFVPWEEITEVKSRSSLFQRLAGIGSIRIRWTDAKTGARSRLPDLGPYDRIKEIQGIIKQGRAHAWPAFPPKGPKT